MVNQVGLRLSSSVIVTGLLLSNPLPAQAKAERLPETVKKVSRTRINTEPAKTYAQSFMLQNYGWADDEFQCLESLWNSESGWNHKAHNRSSGAYGIPQSLPGNKMRSAGSDWRTNPETQIRWGLSYIESRYGTPCAAHNHFKRKRWY